MTAGNKAEGRKCSREVAESYILHCKKKEKLELPWTFQSSKATQNNTVPPEKTYPLIFLIISQWPFN